MPGVPETLSGGVNEKGDRGWAREETPGVLGAAPLPGEKPLGPHKPWQVKQGTTGRGKTVCIRNSFFLQLTSQPEGRRERAQGQ